MKSLLDEEIETEAASEFIKEDNLKMKQVASDSIQSYHMKQDNLVTHGSYPL